MRNCPHCKASLDSGRLISGRKDVYDITWCSSCGVILHAADGGPVNRGPWHEDWCRENVEAFGCEKETRIVREGRSPLDSPGDRCAVWCGQRYCAVSLENSGE